MIPKITMDEKNRKFKGVWIPRELWFDPSLSFIEKCMLVEIDSLDNEEGCTAGNEYLSKFFQVGVRQVKRYISRFKSEKFISVQVKHGRSRVIHTLQRYRQMGVKNVPHGGHKCHSQGCQKCPSSKLVSLNKLNNNGNDFKNRKRFEEMRNKSFEGKSMR